MTGSGGSGGSIIVGSGGEWVDWDRLGWSLDWLTGLGFGWTRDWPSCSCGGVGESGMEVTAAMGTCIVFKLHTSDTSDTSVIDHDSR